MKSTRSTSSVPTDERRYPGSDPQQEAGESDPLLDGGDQSAEAAEEEGRDGRALKSKGHHRGRSTVRKFCLFGLMAALASVVLLAIVLAATRRDGDRKGGKKGKKSGSLPDWERLPGPQLGQRNPAYLVRSRKGAVATEVKECSEIGVEILREGGTATDAAIAAALCIGTTNMFSSGIGGGGFMVIRPPTSQLCTSGTSKPGCKNSTSIDFRETAPYHSHSEMYRTDPKSSQIGGLAVGVPGELRGFEAAYKTHGGGVSWEKLFAPAIQMARGHKVGTELGKRLKIYGGWMMEKEEWKKIFAPDGEFLSEGDWIARPAYARTLETLAERGADAFYTGPIAESIVAKVQSEQGLLSLSDMKSYKAIVEPALTGTYRNRTVYTTHAPSGGPVLLHLLNTAENYDFVEEGRTPLNVHRYIEALKFSFARRTEIGDPAFVDVQRDLDNMITKELAFEVAKNITDDITHTIEYYNPSFDILEDHGTTHLSVIDSQGSAVSLTTTVNLIFGSRVMDPETGIIMNDEMDDFSTKGVPNAFGLRPSPFNYPDARRDRGKRPLSSTSPAIIDQENGDVWLALGGSGGSRIFGSVAQVILNLDWGFDLSHAIEEPRVHEQLLPAYVSIESGYPPELIEGLKDRGHNVTVHDINVAMAEVQAVMKSQDDWIYAASDSRKNGVPAAW